MNRLVLMLVPLMVSLIGISADVRAAAAADALEARVTIAFSQASAADVIGSLAAAAGVKAEIAAGSMRPVTITLTNVKLGTALNAVCENALCSWRLSGSLKVTPLPSESSALLPPRVSFELWDVSPADVFRALASAIGAALTIEPSLPRDPVSFNFKSAPTAEVLNILCNMLQCSWDFDPQRGLRVMQKR
jgi:type II secretory pathway component GspD/PulD (secretin)